MFCECTYLSLDLMNFFDCHGQIYIVCRNTYLINFHTNAKPDKIPKLFHIQKFKGQLHCGMLKYFIDAVLATSQAERDMNSLIGIRQQSCHFIL